MRAEILREREKRRAAMKGSMPYGLSLIHI